MKNLDEKKLLARMARGFGQPDLQLEESIRLEEELNARLFKKPEEPKIPVLREEVPKPAETNIVPKEQELIKQTVAAISSPKFTKSALPDLQQKEIDGLRRQVAEVIQKLGTMSWGGGGTGVVRFFDLDDHQNPRDIKYITFRPTGPDIVPPEPYSMGWNQTEECLDIYQPDNTTLQVGLETYIRVANYTGNTLNAGIVVQFAGATGGNPHAAPALANTTYNPLYTIGVLTEDLLDAGDIGRATTFGKVRGINTTGSLYGETWALGDILYISPTIAGGLTKDQPTAPNTATVIAAVTKVGTTDGELLVRPTITPRLYYGSFADTVSQNCAASLTPTPMIFNKTEFASGHRVVTYNGVANSAIQSDYHGLFNYQFSSQFTSSSASRAKIWIWARKNGTDIPDSATVVDIESNGGVTAPAWNFVVSMQPTDKFQLMWATDSYDKITMIGQPATAFCPAIPSVLLTVSQINQ